MLIDVIDRYRSNMGCLFVFLRWAVSITIDYAEIFLFHFYIKINDGLPKCGSHLSNNNYTPTGEE